MKINDTELFAASVVQSSSENLTLQEKLDLFIEAKELAEKHNEEQPLPSAKVQSKPEWLY
ncbi:TPA: hypothetical protein ACGBG5_003439 [Enterococcus faecalis]